MKQTVNKRPIENSASATETSSTADIDNIMHGEDAFSLLDPLNEIAFNITTPTGKQLNCRSKFIGIHSNNLLLLEKPHVSAQEFTLYFQRGYSIKACALSQKGEGARIYFKSKIAYVVQAGENSIILISLPTATQIAQGPRVEARLDVSLQGELGPNKYHCEIRDISEHGCQLVTDRNINDHNVGDLVAIKIIRDDEPAANPILSGTIKNKKLSNRYWKYGLQFNEKSQIVSSLLLDELSFDHAKQCFQL